MLQLYAIDELHYGAHDNHNGGNGDECAFYSGTDCTNLFMSVMMVVVRGLCRNANCVPSEPYSNDVDDTFGGVREDYR